MIEKNVWLVGDILWCTELVYTVVEGEIKCWDTWCLPLWRKRNEERGVVWFWTLSWPVFMMGFRWLSMSLKILLSVHWLTIKHTLSKQMSTGVVYDGNIFTLQLVTVTMTSKEEWIWRIITSLKLISLNLIMWKNPSIITN